MLAEFARTVLWHHAVVIFSLTERLEPWRLNHIHGSKTSHRSWVSQ